MAAVAPKETDQAAAAAVDNDNNARPPAKLLPPQLLMAACRGDSKRLKELLVGLKKDDDDERGMLQVPKAAAAKQDEAAAVIVEVDRRRHPPPPPPAAAAAAQPPLPLLELDGVTAGEGDSLLHVVAAIGDSQEFLDCATMIHDQVCKGLLGARNNKGDTPLHCAAAAGNAHMITCLVGLVANNGNDDEDAAERKKGFVKTQNHCGETALHHAVRAPHTNTACMCIDELMKHDPDLACVLHKDGTSPLYVAISMGNDKIAEHLYYSKIRGKLSYSGPDGRNVLHAAVPRGQALRTIFGWLMEDDMKQPREDGPTIPGPGTCGSSTVPAAAADHDGLLLTQLLTSQKDKNQKGSTPLHLAASLEAWPDAYARLLQTRFPPVRLGSMSATALLLDINESTAYQTDDQGWYPIHVAAHAGSLSVVKILLERCPNCATLRDGQGRTFLHVAAEKSRFDVVGYVVWGRKLPFFQLLSQNQLTIRRCFSFIANLYKPLLQPAKDHLSRRSTMILNAQDSSGNTALHSAVRAGNLDVFNCLFRNRQVRLDVANKQGMTPLDLSLAMIPTGLNYTTTNPRNIVCSSLLAAGAPHGRARPELFSKKHMPKRDEESTKYTEATQAMGAVAALIATVTFASAFTLPGGYRSADGGGAAAGTPVLAGSYAFNAFILADTLAFACSITATCTLIYAGVPALNMSLRSWYVNVSAVLLQSATRSLMAAIALGLYLVLVPVDRTMTVAVCMIIFTTPLYWSMGAMQITELAITVSTRIGIPPCAVVCYFVAQFGEVFVHFGSYVIIFGFPAIWKWVIPAIHKWFHQKQL